MRDALGEDSYAKLEGDTLDARVVDEVEEFVRVRGRAWRWARAE